MEKSKRKWLLVAVVGLFFMSLSASPVSAELNAFLVKAIDGSYYEYNSADLNNSYVSYQMNSGSTGAKMYLHFDGLQKASGKVIGLKDTVKGYMDYPETALAFLMYQMWGKSFDINTYFATDSGVKLAEAIANVKVVDKNGNVSGNPSPTDTKLALTANRSLGIPQLQWNEITGATYEVKRGESKNSLVIVAEDVINNAFADGNSTLEKQYYYSVTAKQNGKDIATSDLVLIKAITDSDNDGLSDEEETTQKTDPKNSDTDGDGLIDGIEVFSFKTNPLQKDTDEDRLSDYEETAVINTNPLKKDTDGNGITDDLEDFDKDTINNYDEFLYKSNPNNEDSDLDGLTDPNELVYKTNLIQEDSDSDGLLDGNEIKLGTNPLNSDSDGDGIKDGDEVFSSKVEVNPLQKDDKIEPFVEMNVTGKNIDGVTITNASGANPNLDENTPGYLGAPFEFASNEVFDNAKLTFKLDSSLLNDPSIEPAIYYFNETTQLLELLPNQTTNVANGTIGVDVTHFSTYIVLNKKSVDEAWSRDMKPPYSGDVGDIELTIGFSIDSSSSMGWNDPNDIRKQTAKEFVDKLDANDKAAVVDFDDTAKVNCPLTSDKSIIKNAIDKIDSSGNTSLTAGMDASLSQLENSQSTAKYVIMLTDGQGDYDQSLTQRAINQKVVVYTIGLGSEVDEALLKGIAEATGGKYYFAEQASDLSGIFEQTSSETIDLTKDSDGDGLSDYHEKNGMRLNNGKTLYTNLYNNDSDGDGLLDGEEGVYSVDSKGIGYFAFKTDPNNKDTDGDGYGDKSDVNPNIWDISDRDLLMCSKLVYKDWQKGAMINESELKYGWTVCDTYTSFTGISCTAFKKDNNIIFAYRGSELGDVGKLISDWYVADYIGYVTGLNAQEPEAKLFLINVMNQNPGCKIYETGHSLGGFLAKKAAAVSILLYKDRFNKVATFNGLGFFPLNFVGIALNGPDLALLNSVEASNVISYEINGDVVSDIGVEPGLVIHWDRSQKLIDNKKLTDDIKGKHDLLNFYERIVPIRSLN